MTYPIISADSHVTEPPNAFIDNIDPKFRDRAPHIQHIEGMGDIFVIEGMKTPIPLGIVAAAGKPAEEIRLMGTRFEDLHRGGWDPEARIADQARDGVAAEVVYPTVGMAICNHRDLDYKKACCDAYNRWLAGYCAPHPERLLGVGQTAMRTPAEGIDDIRGIQEMGLRGVMMPGHPGVEYYAESIYTTFQDDWVAFKSVGMMNWRRLMWANDFPHSDSTWPWSQQMLAEHTGELSEPQRRAILCENVAELYRTDLGALG